MALTSDNTNELRDIASDTLEKFKIIAEKAKIKFEEGQGRSSDAFAALNTLTGNDAVRTLDAIRDTSRESYALLMREPAIARVVVEDKKGHKTVYYICRTTPLSPSSGVKNFASYRSPIGRLASLPVCETFRTPDGQTVEVVQRALLHPFGIKGPWDSLNSNVETVEIQPLTIDSFLSFLSDLPKHGQSVLDALLAEEQRNANVSAGIRRSVIVKMGLRDQPVLDQYQDEIFRLPLSRRLLLLGAPGTGKTTTLIRRLGQKLDVEMLGEEEDEKRIVNRIEELGGIPHAVSWLMFTPTELLKQYLKEAFAREGIAASDLNIRTWDDWRRELARNTFGVLRTASGGGSFIMKESAATITEKAEDKPISWYGEFESWQREQFFQALVKAAQLLRNSEEQDAMETGLRLNAILAKHNSSVLFAVFPSLMSEAEHVDLLISRRKVDTDNKVRACLNLQVNKNREFLDHLAAFLDNIQVPEQITESDEEEEEAESEEGRTSEGGSSRTGRLAAANAYERAIRAEARALAAGRALNKNSLNGKIIEWLGDRTLDESARETVGASLLIQRSARWFSSPARRYMRGIAGRYRAFRRIQRNAGWYADNTYSPSDLHPLEVDLILLSILRGGQELLSLVESRNLLNDARWTSLKVFRDLRRNQILVDEATDFSPIQLACMAELAHPQLKSFFACGDFNQRLTVWGSKSIDDVKWVYGDFDIRQVSVSYRQSKQLNELAHAIIRAVGGSVQEASLPRNVDNNGVAPVLVEGAKDLEVIAKWLGERIREIERHIEQLPSVAIFVNSEAEVEPLSEQLTKILSNDNIRAVACPQGQVMGHDNDVRVFDVKHIKGLEFEAVFFVSVDELVLHNPRLFDKYLYVGTTRAATYLGLTCKEKLPSGIATLRQLFITDWRG